MVIIKKLPACVDCRRRKVGCSRQRPACSNCIQRGEPCCYPDNTGEILFNEEMANIYSGKVSKPKSDSLGSLDISQEERSSRRKARLMGQSPMEYKSALRSLSAEKESSSNSDELYVPNGPQSGNIFSTNVVDNTNNNNNYRGNSTNTYENSSAQDYLINSTSSANAINYNDNWNTMSINNNASRNYEREYKKKESKRSNRFDSEVPLFDDIYEILVSDKYDKVMSYSQEDLLDKQINILRVRLEYLKNMKAKRNIQKVDADVTGITGDRYIQKLNSNKKNDNMHTVDYSQQESDVLDKRLLDFINHKFSSSTIDIDSDLFGESFRFKLFQNSNEPIFTKSYIFSHSTELKKFHKELFKNAKLKSFLQDPESKKMSTTGLVNDFSINLEFPKQLLICGDFWCSIFQNDFIKTNNFLPGSLFSIFTNYRKFAKQISAFDFTTNLELQPSFLAKTIEYTFVLLWCYYSISHSSVYPRLDHSSPYFINFSILSSFVPLLEKNFKYGKQYWCLNQTNKFLTANEKSRLLFLFQLYNTYLNTDFEQQLYLLNSQLTSKGDTLKKAQFEHYLELCFFQGATTIQLNGLTRFQNIKQTFLTSVKENKHFYSYRQLEDMLMEWKDCLEENTTNASPETSSSLDGIEQNAVIDTTELEEENDTHQEDQRSIGELIHDYRERLIFEHASLFINYYKILDYHYHHYGEKSKLENETVVHEFFLKSCLTSIGTSFEILSNIKLNKFQIFVSNFAYKTLISVATMLFSMKYLNPKLVKKILIKMKLLTIEQTGGLVEKYFYNTELGVHLDVFLHYYGYEEFFTQEDETEQEAQEEQSGLNAINGKKHKEVNGENKLENEELTEIDQVLNDISVILMDDESFDNADIPPTYGVQEETAKEIYKCFYM